MNNKTKRKNIFSLLLLIAALAYPSMKASAVQLPEPHGITEDDKPPQTAVMEDGTEIPLTYHQVEGEDRAGTVLDDLIYEGPVYANLEPRYNPLDNGSLPAIRNQNPYGTCWAFTSVGLGETFWYLNGKDSSINLSPLHLAYFSYNSVTDPLGGLNGDLNTCLGGNFLNQGGNLSLSCNVLANWVGAADEETAPYSSAKATLQNGLDPSVAYEDSLHLQGAYSIKIKQEPEVAKQMIKKYGGIGISYYDDRTYYNDQSASYYYPYEKNTNHAVMVVGWDDNFKKENFDANNTPPEDGAWLVRNSWGGQALYSRSSYFWMSYYDQSLYSVAYAFEYESADNYDHNYQYDGGMMNWPREGRWGQLTAANVFTAKANPDGAEYLRSVSFDTHDGVNLDYRVEIYTDLADPSDPESGILATDAVTTGKTTLSGYYTIPLNASVPLKEGMTFSVVVTLARADGEAVYIGAEHSYDRSSWFSVETAALAGQSFMKSDFGWIDYGLKYNGNIRIKAFVDSYSPLNPITQLSFENEAVTINRDESFALAINASPADNDSLLFWSSSDPSVVTVDNTGRITGKRAGNADITVSDGKLSAVCAVTVKIPAVSINLNLSSTGLIKGEKITLEAEILPEDTTDILNWSSSESRIASVNGNGTVYAMEEGTTVITASAGTVNAQCSIRVKSPFVDISKNRWYYDVVYYVYRNDIMSGSGNSRFAPNDSTTRAMVVQILYNLVGNPPISGNSGFNDVSPNRWYADAITWAVQNKITSGVSSTRFAPDQEVTRQEMAMFLFRFAQWKGYDTSGRNNLSAFRDRREVAGWAVQAMQWANHSGIINGKGNGILDPLGTASRAEIAAMICGFQQKYQ